MTKHKKGSFTVEASVIIPVLLFAIGVIIMLLFYCHDKNVLAGAAKEVVFIEAGRSEKGDYEDIIEGRLLWFKSPKVEVTEEGGFVVGKISARGRHLKIQVEEKARITTPETYIRNVRKLKNMVGGNNGEILPDGFE